MLTEVECCNAVCPADKKRVRLTDSEGLYLEVSPNGSKRRFWKIYADGKESRLALGRYPAVSLSKARLARTAARLQKSTGINPVQARKIAKLKESALGADTFKDTALEWYEKHKSRWSDHYAVREKRNLEKDLFPYFGKRRISEIEPIELLAAIRKVEERGALDVAHRVHPEWECHEAGVRMNCRDCILRTSTVANPCASLELVLCFTNPPIDAIDPHAKAFVGVGSHHLLQCREEFGADLRAGKK